MVKRGEMKIQQMVLMIIAIFIFFILVGLFVLNIKLRGLTNSAESLQRQETIAILKMLTSVTELSYSSSCYNCLDEDKLEVLASSDSYDQFWPIASLNVYKIHPPFKTEQLCPGVNCNYYEPFKSSQNVTEEISTYINLCKKRMNEGTVYDSCEIAKILVGIRN